MANGRRIEVIALAAAVAAGAAAASLGAVALLVPIGIVGLVAVGVTAYRRTSGPIVLILAVSAGAALAFLPASIGDEGQREGLLRYGIAVSAAILLAGLISVTRSAPRFHVVVRGSRLLDLAMIGWIVLGLMVATVGLIYGNPAPLIAGDVYRFLSLPAIYFVTANSIRNVPALRTFVFVVAGLLFVQHGRDALDATIALATSDVGRLKSVAWIQSAIGVVALVTAAFAVRGPWVRILLLWAAAAVFLVGLSRGFRTYLAVLAIGGIIPFILQPAKIPRLARAAAVALIVVAIPALVVVAGVDPIRSAAVASVESISARVDRLLTSELDDESAASRELEVALVAAELENQPVTYLTGHGAGSTFSLPATASPYALSLAADSGFEVHNVHNSYAAIIFRSGVLGAGLLVFTFLAAGIGAFRVRGADPTTWFPLVAVVMYAASSPFFFFVPGDIAFAIVAGSVGALSRIAAEVRRAERPPLAEIGALTRVPAAAQTRQLPVAHP